MIPIPTSAHNEALSGDTLYSAFLNYEWRQIVLPYVIRGMEEIARSIEDETERQDFEVLYGAMIDDFYNEDILDGTPVGTVVAFFGTEANIPAKWLLCDGSSYTDDDYPELYNIMPTGYKGGGNFQVPNFVSRTLFGAIDPTLDIGVLGGENDVTLTVSQIPAHHHDQYSKGGTAGAVLTTAGYLAQNATSPTITAIDTGDTGGGASHNNIPANINVNFIIKALP